MKVNKLHVDEVEIDAKCVGQLLASHDEQYSSFDLRYVATSGTDNVIYRVGGNFLIRLPRTAGSELCLLKELEWLPYLSPKLTLDTPCPKAKGMPNDAYPFAWAIYNWLDGEVFEADQFGCKVNAGETLAQFVSELREIDPAQGPKSDRDSDLFSKDPAVLKAIDALDDDLDEDAVRFAWEALSQSPPWEGKGVWIHGDLLPGNILVKNHLISAVIDFGLIGVGDPAVDLIPAWSTLRGDARKAFRTVLEVDDFTWFRGQGFALRQALKIIPYYRKSNPSFAAMACRTVEEILDDFAAK